MCEEGQSPKASFDACEAIQWFCLRRIDLFTTTIMPVVSSTAIARQASIFLVILGRGMSLGYHELEITDNAKTFEAKAGRGSARENQTNSS
jgi:hypothetical protein